MPRLRFRLSLSDLGSASHGQPHPGDLVDDSVNSCGADEGESAPSLIIKVVIHTLISLMPRFLSGCFHGIAVILKELLFLALSGFFWE